MQLHIAFDSTDTGIETGTMSSLQIHLIPCLGDNYAVAIENADTGETLLIDAPHGASIKSYLQAHSLRLTDILITHHHSDHTEGCQALKDHFGCRITGPQSEAERIPGISRGVSEGTQFEAAGVTVRTMETPGHTLGHVTYYLPDAGIAFTGDTLFALGCGRIFEGDAQTMYASLQKIAELPDDTQVYCGHEYTLANAKFALSAEPENAALVARAKEIEAKRARGEPTLPTTIALEKATNPFLRPQSRAIRARLGMEGMPDWHVFARLRELKNKA